MKIKQQEITLNKKLLQEYKKRDTFIELINYCYQFETQFQDGIRYGDNLIFQALLDRDSLWQAIIITHIGSISIRELDTKIFCFEAYDNKNILYDKFLLDISKTSNLQKLKTHFADDQILSKFKSQDHPGKTFADLLCFHFQSMRRNLISNYRSQYKFLWEDSGCHSGIDLYHNLQNIS